MVSAAVSIYGFPSHTRAIRRLGLLEWLFVTPSHHSLHHARNEAYLDRNYGKVLILWDRLFGTIVKQDEEPIYGIAIPLGSWNPLWANVQPFAELARKVKRTRGLADRLRVLVLPPGWSPRDMAAKEPMDRPDPSRGDCALRAFQAPRLYVLAQFVPAVVVAIALLNVRGTLPTSTFVTAAAVLAATVAALGGLLDGRSWARRVELVRVGVVAVLALMIASSLPVAALAITLSASMAVWLTSRRELIPARAAGLELASGTFTPR